MKASLKFKHRAFLFLLMVAFFGLFILLISIDIKIVFWLIISIFLVGTIGLAVKSTIKPRKERFDHSSKGR